ncbi:hypothetical protein Lser_V15G35543 [Lactuca serriola]
MAEIVRKHGHRMSMNRRDEVGKEKWAKHYSSNHQILLVGEGDFSFSLSLAMSFGSASNIVATSLDSYDILIKKYNRAKSNLGILRYFGAQLLHGVDSINMKLHTDLRIRKFDRIVYNFPHAGFLGKESDHLVIMMHKNLVRGFFMNAIDMLLPKGEVHVTHKTAHPFDTWNIEELATQSGLTLIECIDFKIEDYPGYNNKRGDGKDSDLPFPLGKCSTFKFILSSQAMEYLTTSHHRRNSQQPQEIPLQTGNARMDSNPSSIMMKSKECFWIFREYFNHARLTSGKTDDYLPNSVKDMLRIGFERYNAENHGKPLDGYVDLLKELHSLSKERVTFLQRWLMEMDHYRL